MPIDPSMLPTLLAQSAAARDFQKDEFLSKAPAHVRDAHMKELEILSNLKAGDTDPWMGLKIHKIIRKSSRFIVYLDESLGVQWWWLVRPDEKLISSVQARINQLTHESSFLLIPYRTMGQRLRRKPATAKWEEAENIRSVIGEAMAMALNNGTEEDCNKVLSEAARFIAVSKDQRCRPSFIGSFISVVAGMGLLAFIWHCMKHCCVKSTEWQFVNLWSEAAVAGAFGAMISAMTRTRDLDLQPAAGNRGLLIEATARAFIGAGSGMLVHFAFDSGLILKGALAGPAQSSIAISLFLCIAAGASERILPSLVNRADTLINGSSPSGSDKEKAKDTAPPPNPAPAAAPQAPSPEQPVG